MSSFLSIPPSLVQPSLSQSDVVKPEEEENDLTNEGGKEEREESKVEESYSPSSLLGSSSFTLLLSLSLSHSLSITDKNKHKR